MKKTRLKKSESSVQVSSAEFIVSARPAPGTAITHGGASQKVVRSIEEMGRDFDKIFTQVGKILQNAEESSSTLSGSYALDEIKIGLAFDASGKIAFIAGVEAGVEASVEITFKRKAK